MQRSRRRPTVLAVRFTLTVVALLASVLATSPPAAAQHESDDVSVAEIPASGRFQNRASGKCLDASEGGAGRDVIQWACHTGANQKWIVHDLGNGLVGLQNQASWQCLTALGADQGWDAVQEDCGWSANQVWFARPVGSTEWLFENLLTRKCLDASDWGRGVNVFTYDCHGGTNQRWHDMGG